MENGCVFATGNLSRGFGLRVEDEQVGSSVSGFGRYRALQAIVTHFLFVIEINVLLICPHCFRMA